MSSRKSRMANAKTVVSTIGTFAAAAMVARSVVKDYLPPEFKEYLSLGIRNFLNRFSNQLTMVIYEFNGLHYNEIYDAAQIYLATKTTPNTHRLKVTKPEKEKVIHASIEINEEVQDTYNGIKFNWVLVHKKTQRKSQYNRSDHTSTVRSDVRSFELSFHRKHSETALNDYLPFILNEVEVKKQKEKTLKIFTVGSKDRYSDRKTWSPVNLNHPATFDTLAMEMEEKAKVMKDLERFVKRREYYRKVGKAWKRGYLLYGPPGTGKSSLIAAMANYLNFDIYDLELTEIKRNSELRRLLVATGNRSILVVEDIDCSVELHDRVVTEAPPPDEHRRRHHREENKVTLSGFLNFIDGLWSSCGDERLIIFTTNRKEKLDPALLRPGRMDVHIHMSYCTPCGFQILATNYLGITNHELFSEIKELIQATEVTPAEVAEQLLKDDNPDISLSRLIDFLHMKKEEAEE